LVNIASFEQKVPHVNPVDGKSMNRFYPGNPNGTQTERASWAMTKQVVEKSDYLIDLHGGDLDESLRPYSYWAPTGNAQQDAVSRAMVLAFGLDTIILATDRPRDPNTARYLETNACSLLAKPCNCCCWFSLVSGSFRWRTRSDFLRLVSLVLYWP
jgi:predicted deacylase